MKRIILKRHLLAAKDAIAEIERTEELDSWLFAGRAARVQKARESIHEGLIALEAMEWRLECEG